MVEFPFKFARTLPELDRIGNVSGEEDLKVAEDSGRVNLERMRVIVREYGQTSD